MQEGEILAGKYRVVSRLGEGGEGSVYLAIHMQTEMFWAIKEIRLKEASDRDAPCHELQMMKRLKNRHLPQIIDVLQQKDCVCLVMEHVRGIPMNKRIKGGRILSMQEVQNVAQQVTEALCYLESRDVPVCHLDIKPSNLILRPDGLIKLVDFGSAWKEKEPVRRMGTDGYAAPEQYRQDTARPDVRTDIYGLGATLYRMISGKTWSQALKGSVVPNCPPEMSDLIRRCLREDPAQRFQSASDLRQALEGMRRKKRRERGRRRILGALAMALPAAALCLRILPSLLDLSADESWDYDKLVREAGVVSEEESREYYRKAFFLHPERSEAYVRFLSEAQADGVFSQEEELFVRDALHTVRPGTEDTYEELLLREPASYLETALQLALAYWYGSPREDSRRIAVGWLQKAVQAAKEDGTEKTRPDKARADMYLQLASVLEKIHAPDTEDAAWNAARYWEDLHRILKTFEGAAGQEDPLMVLKFCRESLYTLAFLSGDLARAGVDGAGQVQCVGQLQRLAGMTRMPSAGRKLQEEMMEEITDAGLAALEAAQRVSETEEGGGT